MLANLLTQLPAGAQLSAMAGRVALYAMVAAAVFATGFIKGKAWEQNVQAGEVNQALIARLAQAELQNRKDTAASLKSAREKAALEARSRKLSGELDEALKAMPPCVVPKAVVDKLNEALQ